MTIEDFKRQDLSSLGDVQPSDWPDITPYFQFYLQSGFCFPVKVVSENKLIGTGCILVHEEVAWLAHIIVSAAHRNKGIGQLITKHLIELALNKKCSTLYLIATDLGAPVYEKLGFETETDYHFFINLTAPDPTFSSEYIVPFHPKHEETLLALDELVSGENRRPHLLQHAPEGFVYHKNNQIEGYYLPSFSEGPIIASTSEAGIELLKMKLLRDTKIGFPKDNSTALHFLESHGHKTFKTAKRMRMGETRPVQFDKMYGRIGGYLG
jgi:GNAT superfamily N-acetyltransferase